METTKQTAKRIAGTTKPKMATQPTVRRTQIPQVGERVRLNGLMFRVKKVRHGKDIVLRREAEAGG